MGKPLPLFDHGALLPLPFGACKGKGQLVFRQENFVDHARNRPDWRHSLQDGQPIAVAQIECVPEKFRLPLPPDVVHGLQMGSQFQRGPREQSFQ